SPCELELEAELLGGRQRFPKRCWRNLDLQSACAIDKYVVVRQCQRAIPLTKTDLVRLVDASSPVLDAGQLCGVRVDRAAVIGLRRPPQAAGCSQARDKDGRRERPNPIHM